jgi:hypothetical protein
MNIRNGNSNSVAAPVRSLDPVVREEWSATNAYAFLFVHSFLILSVFSVVPPDYFPPSFILSDFIILSFVHSLFFISHSSSVSLPCRQWVALLCIRGVQDSIALEVGNPEQGVSWFLCHLPLPKIRPRSLLSTSTPILFFDETYN